MLPYLTNLLFSKEPKSKKIGKIFIWNIRKKLNSIPYDADAIFIKNDKFYSHFFEKQGFTIIPEWISTTLDISKPLEKIYENLKEKEPKSNYTRYLLDGSYFIAVTVLIFTVTNNVLVVINIY